jgi:hypothetical protein
MVSHNPSKESGIRITQYSDQSTGWMAEEMEFNSLKDQEMFLFTIVSIPVLESTQPLT